MDLLTLKKIRADLEWVKSDPLTHIQSFHLHRAIAQLKAEIERAHAEEEARLRMIPSLRDDGPIAARAL